MENRIIGFCKKYAVEILAVTIVVLAVAVIFLSGTIREQQGVITQLNRDNSERAHIINTAFQKSEGNVYTDYVAWDNGTLYIPVLYRGKIITLLTSNYSVYQSYNMTMLYRWIDSEYYESGFYSCAGSSAILFTENGTLDPDQFNPFSPKYQGVACTGEGEWINLDLPLDRINEGHSQTFNLGWGQVSFPSPKGD